MSKDIENGKTPKLRFPGFEGEWEERKLGESFDERQERNRGDLPLLSLGEEGLVLQSETGRKDNSNEDKSKYRRVASGDIAYNTMRMWQGRCVCANIEGIVSPAYTVCNPKEGIDGKFHYYLFKTPRMIQRFHQNSQGLVSDTLNLKFEAFSKIKYLLPESREEQEKIASFLSELDNLISAEQEKVDALKELKKGLMQQLFPQNGENTPPIRFPGFEEEWKVFTMEELFEIRNGYTPSKYKSEYWEGGTIPWFRMEDIRKNGHILSDSIQHVTSKAVKGTGLFPAYSILVATTATIGEHAITIADSLANQQFTFLTKRKSLDNRLDIMYFHQYMFLIDEWCKNNTNSGGLLSVNMTAFKRLTVPLPSIEEQQKISSFLMGIDKLVAGQQEKIDSLKAHKKGMMQQLFPQSA